MKKVFTTLAFISSFNTHSEPRATGDLGLIIERAQGSVQIIEHSHQTSLAKMTDLFYLECQS
jgi:protein NirF